MSEANRHLVLRAVNEESRNYLEFARIALKDYRMAIQHTIFTSRITTDSVDTLEFTVNAGTFQLRFYSSHRCDLHILQKVIRPSWLPARFTWHSPHWFPFLCFLRSKDFSDNPDDFRTFSGTTIAKDVPYYLELSCNEREVITEFNFETNATELLQNLPFYKRMQEELYELAYFSDDSPYAIVNRLRLGND